MKTKRSKVKLLIDLFLWTNNGLYSPQTAYWAKRVRIILEDKKKECELTKGKGFADESVFSVIVLEDQDDKGRVAITDQ